MKKVYYDIDTKEVFYVTSNLSSDNSKHLHNCDFILVDDDVSVTPEFDSVENGILIKGEQNILDNLFINNEGVIENIPLNTKVWINSEVALVTSDSSLKIEKEYPEQSVMITLKLYPHKDKVLYA